MGPLFVFIVGVIIAVPVGFVIGLVLNYTVVPAYYKIRGIPVEKRLIKNDKHKIIVSILISVTFTGLIAAFIITGFVLEIKDADNFWESKGLFDTCRLPVEYPYHLIMDCSMDDAQLEIWKGRILLTGITHYHKSPGNMVGKCHTVWFSLDYNTGVLVKYESKEEFLKAVPELGYNEEPELLTIRDNWKLYWSNH